VRSTAQSATHSERAIEVAETALASIPTIDAAAVFGSVARAQADERSDIDLLLVSQAPLRVTFVRDQLAQSVDLAVAAFVVKTWKRLEQMRHHGGFFFRHLQTEAKVLADKTGRLEGLLAPPLAPIDETFYRESIRGGLALYKEPERLGNFHLFALAHLYALAKRAALLRLHELGQNTFDPDELFGRLKQVHPDMQDEIDELSELRTLFGVVRGAPSRYVDTSRLTREQVERVRDTISRLLQA
jgi:predicted nucleotidyltransferase